MPPRPNRWQFWAQRVPAAPSPCIPAGIWSASHRAPQRPCSRVQSIVGRCSNFYSSDTPGIQET